MKAVVTKERVEGDWLSTGSAAAFEFVRLTRFCIPASILYAGRSGLLFLRHIGGSGIEGGPAMGTGSITGANLVPTLRAEQRQFGAAGWTVRVALAHCRATVRAEGLAAGGALGCARQYGGATTGTGYA